MQLIFGTVLRVFGLVVIICTVLFLIIALYFGINEAMTLNGPSRYDQVYRALKYGAAGLVAGLALRGLGGFIRRRAPPLEEVRLPVDPNL